MNQMDGIPVSGDLLLGYAFEAGPSNAVPLMMEFEVNPETGPFLISSSKSLLWVNRVKDKRVRAAFRPLDLGGVFLEVVLAVQALGSVSEWGNVQPLSFVGIQAAIAHLLSYDLPSPEILAHPDTKWGDVRISTADVDGVAVRYALGCRIHDALWLDPRLVVVLPSDKAFVGFVLKKEGRGVVVVHNASRGIVVCGDVVRGDAP